MILDKYYRFNQVTGLSIEIGQDGTRIFHICGVQVDGTQLHIVKKAEAITDLNELKKHVEEKTIVAVNLSGKGVLIKKIAAVAGLEELDFGAILPNANQDDFNIQLFSSGANTFVSLIRKQEAEKWLTMIKTAGINAVSLSLGPFAVNQIVPQLNVYGEELVFGGHAVHRNDQGDWINYKYAEEATSVYPTKLENEKIEEKLLLPYAVAFQLILYPRVELIKADHVALDKVLHEKMDNIKFRVKGAVFLMVVFLILLVNFLLFSYYNAQNGVLANQVGESVQLASNAEAISDSLHQRQKQLLDLGWEGKVDKSVIIDQIAQLLPPGVKWQQVTVDPLIPDPGHNNGKRIFASKQILINGTSQQLIPVNEWIARLKTKAWVKNVELQNYYYNNELDTGQFAVAITY